MTLKSICVYVVLLFTSFECSVAVLCVVLHCAG